MPSAALRRSVATGAGWLLAAVLGDLLFSTPAGPALWLAGGFLLAVLIRGPGRRAPVVGALLAAAAHGWARTGSPLASMLGACAVAEPVLAWRLLEAWQRRRPASAVASDRLGLVMIPVAAVAWVLAVAARGDPWTAWTAHYAGTVLATPIAAAALGCGRRVTWPRPTRLAEAGLLAATLWAVAHDVFASPPLGSFRPLPYVILPVLVWSALRFGVARSAVVFLFLSREALSHTLAGGGPFLRQGQSPEQVALQLQLFLCCVGVSVLVLAGSLEERARTVAALRHAEAALQRAQELSQQSEAAAHVGSWRLEIATRTVQLSPEALRLARLAETSGPLDVDALIERVVYRADRDAFREAVARLVQDERQRSHEFRLRTSDGALRILRTEGGDVVRTGAGEPVRVFGILEDVTDQRRLERALRESEERYRGLFEDSPTVMLLIDSEDGRVLDANPAACAFYGRSREQMHALRIHEISSSPAARVDAFLARAREKRGLRGEVKHRLASGELRDVFVYSGPVRVGQRTVVHSVVHDVTDTRRAEEAALRGLREAGATLRGVIEATPLGVLTFDGELRVRLANPAGREIFGGGTRDPVGRLADELLGREHVEAILRPALEGRPVVGVAIERRRDDGTPVALRAFAGPLNGSGGEARGVVALFEDASERRLMEETLQLAQKLEVLATVAGGVAHDFNNLLTVVLGHTERALRKLPSEAPARSHLERALPAVEQAIALAGKMLIYAGGSRPVVGPLDLAALVRDDRAVLEAAVPSHVTLQIDLAAGTPVVEASAEEIRQALTALLANAVEAIGGRRGKIRVRVASVSLAEGDPVFSRHTGQPIAAGEYVSLVVADDGGGIRPHNLPRIFDPFFTTKFVGRGLGLAAVLGIVRSLRGGVAVESTPGVGTRLELVFPALIA
jgi:PAS domain S-box-containing protein